MRSPSPLLSNQIPQPDKPSTSGVNPVNVKDCQPNGQSTSKVMLYLTKATQLCRSPVICHFDQRDLKSR